MGRRIPRVDPILSVPLFVLCDSTSIDTRFPSPFLVCVYRQQHQRSTQQHINRTCPLDVVSHINLAGCAGVHVNGVLDVGGLEGRASCRFRGRKLAFSVGSWHCQHPYSLRHEQMQRCVVAHLPG